MVPNQTELLTNLRRGTLEYCILGILSENGGYGHQMARDLVSTGQLLSSEGTLYPLLTRLRGAGWIESSWQESPAGPPRRHYEITGDGRAALKAFTGIWESFSRAVTVATSGGR